MTLLPLWRPPRHRVYLWLSWLRIYVSLLRWRGRRSIFTRLGWGLVGWIILCCFLRMTSYLRRKGRPIKCGEKFLSSGCPRIKSYTSIFFLGPYLLCVHPETLKSLLEKLHERICESHRGDRSLSHKALTQGYWWPNMQKEAQDYVRKCNQCQRFASYIHQPGVSSILCLAPSLLLNRVWIL